MRRGSIAGFLTVALLAPSAARAQVPPAVRSAAERELDRRVGTPGAVVALVTQDSARVEAFGMVFSGSSEAMRPDLLFGTSSFDGVLVALAASVLHARGAIDLDAPLRRYISDLPPRLGAVTIAQLLSHTAGLDDAEDEAPPRRPVSRIWPQATDRALFTEPGAIHSPSRYGARLARAVLEHHTGRSIAELVDQLVLTPLGMTRSTFDGERADRLGAAPGHVVSTSMARPLVALTPTQNPYPHFYASAGDLARLATAILSGGVLDGQQVLPAAALTELTRPRAARPAFPRDSVAFGWTVTRLGSARALGLATGTAGYGMSVRLLPQQRAGAIVLANGTGAVLEATADTALHTLVPHIARVSGTSDSVQPAPHGTPEDLFAFAGTWANGDRFIVLRMREGELTWVDGDLVLPVRRRGPFFDVIVADGRVAQSFRWTRDAQGRDYLLVGERAFRRGRE